MAINADNAHELKQLDQKVSRKVAQLKADNEEIKLKASEYQEENMKLKFIIAELRHRAVPDEDEDDVSIFLSLFRRPPNIRAGKRARLQRQHISLRTFYRVRKRRARAGDSRNVL